LVTGESLNLPLAIFLRALYDGRLPNIKDSPDIQPTDKQLERLAEDQSP
jgi:hypothetical protein